MRYGKKKIREKRRNFREHKQELLKNLTRGEHQQCFAIFAFFYKYAKKHEKRKINPVQKVEEKKSKERCSSCGSSWSSYPSGSSIIMMLLSLSLVFCIFLHKTMKKCITMQKDAKKAK